MYFGKGQVLTIPTLDFTEKSINIHLRNKSLLGLDFFYNTTCVTSLEGSLEDNEFYLNSFILRRLLNKIQGVEDAPSHLYPECATEFRNCETRVLYIRLLWLRKCWAIWHGGTRKGTL